MVHFMVCLFLSFHTLTDLKERMIFVPVALAGLLTGVGYEMLMNGDPMEMLFRLFPGSFILAAAAVTQEGVGSGDGWAILSVGLFMDPYVQIVWLAAAFLLAAAAFLPGALLGGTGRVQVKQEIAFAPFLLGAYLGGWYGGFL